MPRGVLVVCFLNVVASRLPHCALKAASSSQLTFSFGSATPYGRDPHYGVQLALPAPRSGIPLCLYTLFILLSYFSHIPLTSRTLALPHFRGIPTGLSFDTS